MCRTIGHILYDDTCGFCRSWVPKLRPVVRRQGLEVTPLQDPKVKDRLTVPMADLLTDIHLMFENGQTLRGAEVYRYVMRRVWWLVPIYVLSTLPFLRGVFDWGYRKFADNRYRISKACRLPPGPAEASGE